MTAIGGMGANPFMSRFDTSAMGSSSGGGNPLGGLAGGMGQPGGQLGGQFGGQLGGMADAVGGVGGATAPGSGIAPNQAATGTQGASFGDTLRHMVIDGPSKARATAGDLTARFAAGESIDPHQIAIASAKAGVEIQMATRSISSAVSAVRTLFQMQI